MGIVPKSSGHDPGRPRRLGGPAAAAPAADTAVDLQARPVLPGWVGADTHLIFARDRVDNFTARVPGGSAAGDGLQVMLDSTRAAEDRDTC